MRAELNPCSTGGDEWKQRAFWKTLKSLKTLTNTIFLYQINEENLFGTKIF